VFRRAHFLAGSLKARLALASFLLIAGSVALTVALVLRAMEQRSQRAVLDSELANAERTAVVLSSRLVALQKAMRSASGWLPLDRLDQPPALKRFLDEQSVLRSLFDTVFVASAQGTLLAVDEGAGARPLHIDASDRSYIRRTQRERRPVISQAGVSRSNGAPMFVLTMPVFDHDGEMRAILVCGMRLATNALLTDLTRPGMDNHDPVTTIVIDSTGRIIAHPEPGWMMKDAREDRRFAGAVAQWKAEGQPIEPQGSARRLDDDIVAVAGVPDADWSVFRSGRAELLLGGPAAGRLQAVRIGATVAVAGGLVILLVTLALLLPLRQLERRALRLLDEDIDPGEGWPRAGGELGQLVRVFRHVMGQKAAARVTNDELLGKMQAVMSHAPVGIAFIRFGRFELVSDQFCRLFGYERERAQGLASHVLCPSREDYEDFYTTAATAFMDGRSCDEERQLIRDDGTLFWAHLQGAPIRIGDSSAGTIWIFTDITERRRHREELSWSASHDELTGLVNRREFERHVGEAIAGARGGRAEDGPSAALFIDLDRFKAVNDSSGHAAGDVLLKNIAAILLGRARAHDTVARIGGDEFAVLLRRCDVAAAERIAVGICARVAQYELEWGEGAQAQRLSVGASIGIVAIEPDFASVQDVLTAADEACYDAKRAGRGTVRGYRRATGAALPAEAD
jgi:diguanylate cyclase (GGDEF)-like protein/PAS domain S-box-containing protein